MNTRTPQPEPKDFYGCLHIRYDLNSWEVLEDALGEYPESDEYGDPEPRFINPCQGEVNFEVYIKVDNKMPSEKRIKEILDKVKARLSKDPYKYDNLEVSMDEYFED